MTYEQINLAIHKAVGFEWNNDRKLWERHANKARVVSHQPFNYSSDLNLMHEAEKTLLDAGLLFEYGMHISIDHRYDYLLRATARERAEAFLRTLGKWDDQSGDATEMEVQR